MNLELENQVAVVIGGAKGIGRAIAEAFVREGALLAVTDIDTSVEQAAAEMESQSGRRVIGLRVDATDYAATRRAAAEVARQLGAAQHVVCAAGAGSGKYGFPFWNLEPADWGRVFEINLMSVVHAAHAFAPGMVAAKRGTFAFLSSVAAQIGSQTDPPYSAAKAAVINFAHCAAKDLAPHNVRVNVISPGMVRTAINRSVWQAWHDQQPADQRRSYEDWASEKVSRIAPLGRWQTPEDIASVAVFLASPRAENITGQTINVDGGQVMHW